MPSDSCAAGPGDRFEKATFEDSSVDADVWQFGGEVLSDTVNVDQFREMVTLRRRLHQIPELAFNEHKTAGIVREELSRISGVTLLETPAGGTGVLAVLRGAAQGDGKAVLFRADMDALPIQEGHSSDNRSAKRQKVLAAKRQHLRGFVIFLFQPAEERHPINNPMGGAIRMIRDVSAGEELSRALGARPKPLRDDSRLTTDALHLTHGSDKLLDGRLLDCVDEVYGLHLWNYASAGTIGCGGGSITANSDSLVVTINGTGGHGSAPQGTVDPVVVAAQFVLAAQGIVSRNTSPTESCVITFGKIEGGVAPNVIATTVKLMGTVRTYTQAVKRMVDQRLKEIAFGIAASHGPSCSIHVNFTDGYPACVNNTTCADAVLLAGKRLLGERVVGPCVPNMAGEDFSFFLERKPGAFFFVGSNPQAKFVLDPSLPVEEEEYIHGSKKVVAHHTPEFDIHEGALWCGAAMWVQLATLLLNPDC